MSVMHLSYYPAEVLLQPASNVTDFDETLRRLVDDMFDTMYAAPGVGLAAPQVGLSKRLFVMDCSNRKSAAARLAIANPEIVYQAGEQVDYEGCLSVPGYSYKLARPMNVIVRGQDLNGDQIEYDAEGLEARCVLHETDHLNGILYVSRLSALKRQQILRSIKKKIKADTWPEVKIPSDESISLKFG